MIERKEYHFSSIEVFQTVNVDITQQYESFNVVRVIINQLLEERNRFQRTTSVRQQKRQVEQRRAEIWLD